MDAWLDGNGHQRGAVLDLEQAWALAKAWYGGRMEPSWRGRTAEETRKILDDLGLAGEFWQLE